MPPFPASSKRQVQGILGRGGTLPEAVLAKGVGLTQTAKNGHNLVHDKQKDQTNRLLPILARESNQLYSNVLWRA